MQVLGSRPAFPRHLDQSEKRRIITVDASLQGHMRLVMQYDLFEVLLPSPASNALCCFEAHRSPAVIFSRPAHGCLAAGVGWAAVWLVERPNAFARTDYLHSRTARIPACEKIRLWEYGSLWSESTAAQQAGLASNWKKE